MRLGGGNQSQGGTLLIEWMGSVEWLKQNLFCPERPRPCPTACGFCGCGWLGLDGLLLVDQTFSDSRSLCPLLAPGCILTLPLVVIFWLIVFLLCLWCTLFRFLFGVQMVAAKPINKMRKEKKRKKTFHRFQSDTFMRVDVRASTHACLLFSAFDGSTVGFGESICCRSLVRF